MKKITLTKGKVAYDQAAKNLFGKFAKLNLERI